MASVKSLDLGVYQKVTDTLLSLGNKKKTDSSNKKNSSKIEDDLIKLSPINELKSVLSRFKSGNLETSLSMSITLSSETKIEDGFDPSIDNDLQIMLRMISKDDAEYESLRKRLNDLLDLQKQTFTTPATTSTSLETSTTQLSQVLQQNTYKIDLNFQKHLEEQEAEATRLEKLGIKMADPIVLDLSGAGIKLTNAGQGAVFDINADGILNNTAWVKDDTAMLVFDRNDNGIIDDGSELFGEQNGALNGFEELAKYDSNGDNKIDHLDPIFKALKLYKDINGDGVINSDELYSLPELGIKALNLDFVRVNEAINGNVLLLRGSYESEDGSTKEMSDVLLGYR